MAAGRLHVIVWTTRGLRERGKGNLKGLRERGKGNPKTERQKRKLENWTDKNILQNKELRSFIRAHPGLNRGPIGLQPIALPLSYRPTLEMEVPGIDPGTSRMLSERSTI